MYRLEQSKVRKRYKPKDWLKFIDEYSPRLAIPVGPSFQADLTNVNTLPVEDQYSYRSTTLKWLGTQTWPIVGKSMSAREDAIGKGRPESCGCTYPKSEKCIKQHIGEKKIELQKNLGPVFSIWNFNDMGEEISKSWTSKQLKEFETMSTLSPLSWSKKFSKAATTSKDSFSSKCREEYVKYYFNVFVPRRIKIQTMSNCKIIDSDGDDHDDSGSEGNESLNDSHENKRRRLDNINLKSRNHIKARYLFRDR